MTLAARSSVPPLASAAPRASRRGNRAGPAASRRPASPGSACDHLSVRDVLRESDEVEDRRELFDLQTKRLELAIAGWRDDVGRISQILRIGHLPRRTRDRILIARENDIDGVESNVGGRGLEQELAGDSAAEHADFRVPMILHRGCSRRVCARCR
jgi:hypothetical protein